MIGSVNKPFQTWEDVLQMYLNGKICYRIRDDRAQLIPPMSIDSYFKSESMNAQIQDIECMFSYYNSELSCFGSVEHRIVDTQPMKQILTPSAFCYGLMENKEEAYEILEAIRNDLFKGKSLNELCDRAITLNGAKSFLDTDFPKRLEKVLSLAEKGLSQEERGFLDPLYSRISSLESPAKQRLRREENAIYIQ